MIYSPTKETEKTYAVVGSLALAVPGPEADLVRRKVDRDDIEKELRLMLSKGKVNTRNTENFGVIPFGPNDTDQQLSEKNLHNLALSAQDEGVSPYLILAGVYDKEDGGDEATCRAASSGVLRCGAHVGGGTPLARPTAGHSRREARQRDLQRF